MVKLYIQAYKKINGTDDSMCLIDCWLLYATSAQEGYNEAIQKIIKKVNIYKYLMHFLFYKYLMYFLFTTWFMCTLGSSSHNITTLILTQPKTKCVRIICNGWERRININKLNLPFCVFSYNRYHVIINYIYSKYTMSRINHWNKCNVFGLAFPGDNGRLSLVLWQAKPPICMTIFAVSCNLKNWARNANRHNSWIDLNSAGSQILSRFRTCAFETLVLTQFT